MQRQGVRRITKITLAAVVLSGVAYAQSAGWSTDPASQPNMVYQQFAAASKGWEAVAFKYAQSLFWGLAGIDFAWMAISLLTEGADLQGIVMKLFRWLIKTGFFYAVLLNGQAWMGAIVASFVKIGIEAGGGGAITPAQIMGVGMTIAGKLVLWSCGISLVPLVGTVVGLTGMAAALLVILAFLVVVINFFVTTIESFVVLGAGFIFLGFGGSQWTRPYVERYMGLAVSVGTRLMVLYLIVGLGVSLGNQWIGIIASLGTFQGVGALASAAVGDAKPIGDALLTIFGVIGGAITYAAVAVLCPKIVASVASGALSTSGSDAIGFGVGSGMAGMALASGGMAAISGASSILAGGGAGAAAGSGTMAGMGGGTLSPGSWEMNTSAGPDRSAHGSVNSASSSFSSGGGSGVAMPGFGESSEGSASGQDTFGVGSGAANYVAPPPATHSGWSAGSAAESCGGGAAAARPTEMTADNGVAPLSSPGLETQANSGSVAVPPPVFDSPSSMSPKNVGVGSSTGQAVPLADAFAPSGGAAEAVVVPSGGASSTSRSAGGPASRGDTPAAAGSGLGASDPSVPVSNVAETTGVTSGGPSSVAVDTPVDAGGAAGASSQVAGATPRSDASVPVSEASSAPSEVFETGPAAPTSATNKETERPYSLTEKLAALQYVKNITDVGHAVAPPPPTSGKED